MTPLPCSLDRGRDLACDRERVGDCERPTGSLPTIADLCERLAVDELHDERGLLAFLDAVERRDVRMIERREHARLALETREPVGVCSDFTRQRLDGDL